jgi:predicted GNAT family acetyltransferase
MPKSANHTSPAGVRLEGYTEVSWRVYPHPAYRGRGYAKVLVLLLTQCILERDEVAFLHVKIGNALKSYEKLGFRQHRISYLISLKHVAQ